MIYLLIKNFVQPVINYWNKKICISSGVLALFFILISIPLSFSASNGLNSQYDPCLRSIGYVKQDFNFNKRCVEAYDAIFELNIVAARNLIRLELKENPQNLIPYLLENYIDFLTILIDDKEPDFKKIDDIKDVRIDKIKAGNKSSPYYLYSQAEVLFQWGLIHLKYNQYFSALFELRKANLLLNENQKKFPSFIANKKNLALIHTLIGSIPDNYKWTANILGFDHSIEQGMAEIKEILEYSKKNHFIFEPEVNIIHTFLLLYFLNDDEGAWNLIQNNSFPLEENSLNHFVHAIVAYRTGHNDNAIKVLQDHPRGDQYYKFPYFDYLLGITKMHRLDDDAPVYFKRYFETSYGENYIKNSYQKLAWYYLIRNDTVKYQHYMKLCLRFGNADIGADKQALKEATSGVIPNINLLKARLLSDGGYYKMAIDLLDGKSVKDYKRIKDKVEFTYRAARIYDKWGMKDKSIGFYVATIKNGEDQPYYYAANAALSLGIIYESKDDYARSEYYYKKCLSMKDHEYKKSLDIKSKAGLNRIKDKN